MRNLEKLIPCVCRDVDRVFAQRWAIKPLMVMDKYRWPSGVRGEAFEESVTHPSHNIAENAAAFAVEGDRSSAALHGITCEAPVFATMKSFTRCVSAGSISNHRVNDSTVLRDLYEVVTSSSNRQTVVTTVFCTNFAEADERLWSAS